MCINQFSFVVGQELIGEFNANGVLGFAPTDDERSYIKALKDQKKIENQIVSFNYENP